MNAPLKTVTLEVGAATITIPATEAALAYLEKLLNESRPMPFAIPTPATDPLPVVGSPWQGGIYAGVTLDGDQRAALVLLPGDESLKWEAAKKWATEQGGVLPSRHDQLVLFRNLKAEFKEAWYWSGEQHADGAVYAWSQLFYDGYQNCYGVGGTGRARAVRRIPIR